MKVTIKQEESQIPNDDVKWYLSDESLWITKYDNNAEIEKSIQNSYGSFNWLYRVNDTLLFDRESGKFRLAVISLSGKRNVSENYDEKIVPKVNGDLYFMEKEHCSFEFNDFVHYVYYRDYLYSYPYKYICDNVVVVVSITTDFCFFVSQNALVGWG